MSNLIERTALSPFILDGKSVRTGQVVTVDSLQLDRLFIAGCVYKDDGLNAAVPKADLPGLQHIAADFQREIDDAAASATTQITAIRNSVDEARAKADAEIADVRKAADDEIAEIRTTVDGLRSNADSEVAAHAARVEEARREADRQIEAARLQAVPQGAPSEGETGETPPASGAGKPKR